MGGAIAGLISCTTTPQGGSIDRAQYADLLTTGVALTTVENATEANPIGIYLLPIKLSAGWLVERYAADCADRAQAAGILNTVTWGATFNNLAIIAGASSGLVPGLGAALLYGVFRKRLEPEVYNCDG